MQTENTENAECQETDSDRLIIDDPEDFPLTWWEAIDQLVADLSALDIAEQECNMFPDGMDPGDALVKQKPKKPSVKPYISFNDLNNSKEEPNVNKPKPAIEVGVEVEF